MSCEPFNYFFGGAVPKRPSGLGGTRAIRSRYFPLAQDVLEKPRMKVLIMGRGSNKRRRGERRETKTMCSLFFLFPSLLMPRYFYA